MKSSHKLNKGLMATTDADSELISLNPDLILIGENRDYESAMAALAAVQTGHRILTSVPPCSPKEIMSRLKALRVKKI